MVKFRIFEFSSGTLETRPKINFYIFQFDKPRSFLQRVQTEVEILFRQWSRFLTLYQRHWAL